MPDNLRTLTLSGFPLGARCRACGRRNLVAAERLGAHDGNMTELRELRLVCSRCDGRDVEARIFRSQQQLDDFVAGLPETKIAPADPEGPAGA